MTSHPGGDRWYADIEFAVPAAAQSYNPFVQLAVARYQRDSCDGIEQISPVVTTERVPLLPDRHVIVTRVGNQLNISVEGTSPSPLNRLEAILKLVVPTSHRRPSTSWSTTPPRGPSYQRGVRFPEPASCEPTRVRYRL